METLVKPVAKLNAEISFNLPYRQNRPNHHSFQYIKFHRKWKFLLIVMSFFTFIVFSDSPKIDADICNRFNNEQACSIW
tara:strand:- start:342 stop:578 length:237 start_codon:yes stop_codon:yes gene_type:complete